MIATATSSVAAAAALAFGFTATAADAAGHLHAEIDDLRGGRNDAEEVANSPTNAPNNPNCNRRECFAAVVLDQCT